jgi:hypothetical protein
MTSLLPDCDQSLLQVAKAGRVLPLIGQGGIEDRGAQGLGGYIGRGRTGSRTGETPSAKLDRVSKKLPLLLGQLALQDVGTVEEGPFDVLIEQLCSWLGD